MNKMPFLRYNDKIFNQALEKVTNTSLKHFASSVFEDIVKSSPSRNTLSKGGYLRTGFFKDGWDIKKNINGYTISNTVFYANYYEYGHRGMNGTIYKGNYLMSKAVNKNLTKFGFMAFL